MTTYKQSYNQGGRSLTALIVFCYMRDVKRDEMEIERKLFPFAI